MISNKQQQIFTLLFIITLLIANVYGAATPCEFPNYQTDTSIYAATTITNSGPTIVLGSISVYPGNTTTGFVPNGAGETLPTPQNYNLANNNAILARSDAQTSYNIAFNQACTQTFSTPTDLGNLILLY